MRKFALLVTLSASVFLGCSAEDGENVGINPDAGLFAGVDPSGINSVGAPVVCGDEFSVAVSGNHRIYASWFIHGADVEESVDSAPTFHHIEMGSKRGCPIVILAMAGHDTHFVLNFEGWLIINDVPIKGGTMVELKKTELPFDEEGFDFQSGVIPEEVRGLLLEQGDRFDIEQPTAEQIEAWEAKAASDNGTAEDE